MQLMYQTLHINHNGRCWRPKFSSSVIFSRKSNSTIANVCLSVSLKSKLPQPLRIMPISQISAYLSLLAIMPISHHYPPTSASQNHNYWPSCLSVIMQYGFLTYALLSRLLSHFDLFLILALFTT